MLNKRAFYGDDWDVPSAEHPAGACLNRSAPGVEDGSYLEKAWVNDLMALSGALMNAAGYTPNGTEDNATACQVFDALVNGRWSSIGNYSKGTIITASNGKQYFCNQNNGRDTTVIDPVSDTLDNWREYPYQEVSNSNGTAKKWFNGDLECRINGLANGATWTFPVPFFGSRPNVQNANLRDNLPGTSTTSVPTTTSVIVYSWLLNGDPSGAINDVQATGKWV